MRARINPSAAALTFIMIITLSFASPRRTLAWGDHGHYISGMAAATNLPAGMPPFFRDSAAHLAYLNPEPDRWRVDEFEEMLEGFRYDHYIDLEVLPPGALNHKDRFEYLEVLIRAGMREPEKKAGLLPFHILELYQRLVTEFRLWRATNDNQTRRWIEQRIINDAGLLGHYVTDGANPHHTTIHNNGWASGVPNPNNYTPVGDGFHSRFETQYVGARISLNDLLSTINPAPQVINNPRGAVVSYLRASNGRVERLYQLDKQAKFNAQTTSAAHKQFAVERLAAGANMLRALWWTAWVKSG